MGEQAYNVHKIHQQTNKSIKLNVTGREEKKPHNERNNVAQCDLQVHLLNEQQLHSHLCGEENDILPCRISFRWGINVKYFALCYLRGQHHLWNSSSSVELRKLYPVFAFVLMCGWHSLQIYLKLVLSTVLIILTLRTITLTNALPTTTRTFVSNHSFTIYDPFKDANATEDTDSKSIDLVLHDSVPSSLKYSSNIVGTSSTIDTISSVVTNKFTLNNSERIETAFHSITNSTIKNIEDTCESKILDDLPAEPFYDFRDIAGDAARQFTDFLYNKIPSSPPFLLTNELRHEVKRHANSIANYALNEDDNLLAFAVAAPTINMVVVKFRDNITIPPEHVNNPAILGPYWKEVDYEWNSSNGSQEWGAPFKDCSFLIGRWLWPFRISYFDSKIKIGVAAFIAADEDVCNDGLEQIFGRKHGCDRNTTFCLLTENKPSATRDVYMCICKESYYLPNSTLQGFRGDVVEMSEDFNNFSCIPCPGGCTTCDLNGICLFGEPPETFSLESILKVCVGSILGACILCCIGSSVVVLKQRKSKVIAFGMWTVLEIILIGIVLLYASVAIHFFPASTKRCVIEPWLRELGFITCYGAIILKLYRHLIHFRTRKAHRWILRDVDLLKYLGTMVFAVVCYMSAFTASALDLLESTELESLRELQTNTCRPLKWEYVTQVSEILILCFGLHLAFTSRNAITYFKERQFLVAALIIEFLVSSTFYLLRYWYLPEMSPSTIFLVLFMRSQLTNTVALGLIFVPKVWYQRKRGSHEINQRVAGGYAGLYLGDPDVGELTISEMSPEDIRAELKRLYTQLEILKNKTLCQDNPHISKRRGGRKIGHRRFSLQASNAKHRSNTTHQDAEIAEAERSRTPEDSICSNDGPTDMYPEISGTSQCILP